MRRKPKAVDKKRKDVDFSYEGGPPPRNFLSYREMMLEMSRWATTSTGWSSMLALAVVFFCCLGTMTFLVWLVSITR